MSLVWTIEFSGEARKTLRKLHPETAARVFDFLQDRVATSEDPRILGASLKGTKFEKLWRYRVGDYRIVTRNVESRVIVQVVEIGRRREVYR